MPRCAKYLKFRLEDFKLICSKYFTGFIGYTVYHIKLPYIQSFDAHSQSNAVLIIRWRNGCCCEGAYYHTYPHDCE